MSTPTEVLKWWYGDTAIEEDDAAGAGENPPPHGDDDAPPDVEPPKRKEEAAPAPLIGPRVVGWREFLKLDLPPISWALRFGEHGFLRTAGVVAVAGTPGGFKTTMLVAACADLGAEGHRVGIAELEGDENDLRAEIARAIGERDVPNERILSARYDGFFSLLSPVYRADLVKHLAGKVDVLVLDSLPKMTAGVDENSPDFAGAVALALELQRDVGARLLVVVCHTVKTEWRAGEEPSLADIRGHGSLAGVLDAAFIVRPAKDARERVQEGTAHFELWPVKQRGAPLGPPLDLTYQRAGDGLERSFGVIDRSARGKGGRQPDQSEPELDAAVLSFIRSNGPCSKRQVYGAVNGKDARKGASLSRLVQSKQVQVNAKGRYLAPGVGTPEDA
jgi:hypothetical protein